MTSVLFAGEETMDKLKDADVQQRVDSFTKTFSKEVQDGFKQLNDDINRQRKQKWRRATQAEITTGNANRIDHGQRKQIWCQEMQAEITIANTYRNIVRPCK